MNVSVKHFRRRRRSFRVTKKLRRQQHVVLYARRSLRHIYAQLVGVNGMVIASASTNEESFRRLNSATSNVEAARKVGEIIGQRGRAKGVLEVVFCRGFCAYHGRVQALADGARSGGLKF